jgi:hypothetical protein
MSKVGNVLVTEITEKYKGKQYKRLEVAGDDTGLIGIKTEAATDGFHLRIWLPGTIGTMDLRGDRINVHVDEQEDGTYKVTSLNIG